MEWIIANWPALLMFLYVVLNEVVALAPNLKSNSLVQLLINILKAMVPKAPPAQ